MQVEVYKAAVRGRTDRHPGRDPGPAGRPGRARRSPSSASASSRGSSSHATRAPARLARRVPPGRGHRPRLLLPRSPGLGAHPPRGRTAPSSTSGRSSDTTSAFEADFKRLIAEIEQALAGQHTPRKERLTACTRCPSTASSPASSRSPWPWAATSSPSRPPRRATPDDLRGGAGQAAARHRDDAPRRAAIGLGTYGTLIT